MGMSARASLFPFLRGFTIWRCQRFNSTRGTRYGIYLTRWFFATNYTFPGEQRYYVRITEHWGKSFGGVRVDR
jgi:hypothetical protein